jgi:HEAT repeat protein
MGRFLVAGVMLGVLLPFVGLPTTPAVGAASPALRPQSKPATPPSSNPLIDELKSPNASTRAKAAHELGKSGDVTAIPALSAALKDPNAKVRREVVVALAQMHQAQVLDALITATHDWDEKARVLAVRSLVGYYTGNLPSTGFTAFARGSWRWATARFEADDSRIDPGISLDPKVTAALDSALKSTGSNRVAQEAAKGLGILVAQPAVPDLVKAAHSSDPTLARESLNSLAKIKDRSAGHQLLDLLDSPNKDIKRDAAVTIGILRTEEALPKLQAMFEADPDQKDREKAIEGLAYLGEQPSTPLFLKALWSEDKSIRTSAAEGLARVRDPKTRSELDKAVAAESDADAKLAVEFALTSLGRMDYLSAVVDTLGSRVRGAVAQAYLIELARNPQFLPKLYPYLQSLDAAVRKRLCTVLMFSGNQSSLEQLDRLSHDPAGDVAAEALRAKQAIRAQGSG